MFLFIFKGYAYEEVYTFCAKFKEDILIHLEPLHLRCKYKYIQQKQETPKYNRI